MEGVVWGEGEEDVTHYLSEECARVCALPVNIRYRIFEPPSQHLRVRAGRSAHDFYLHRRRRLDSTIEAELSGGGVPVVSLVQTVLTDSFAIAQRQQSTYQWLAQRRGADAILHRFAVDRKLNAPPCLSVVNRSLRLLGREGNVDAVLDVLEDTFLDTAVIPLSTLLGAIKALSGHPIRAARVALTFKDSLGTQTVPSSVWGNLGAALSQLSFQAPKPLEDGFMDIFQRVLAMVSSTTGRLSESLVVAFGRCMLTSQRSSSTAVRLVREELLSGRSRDGFSGTPLHLSAFLSDLLVQLCREDEEEARGRRCRATADTDTLTFACDVIKYAFAVHVQLAPRVFDEVLALCERRQEFYRMAILFISMCVLSTPSLVSLLRVLEVVVQVPGLLSLMRRLLPESCSSFFLWCLQHHPLLFQLSEKSQVHQQAMQRVCAQLAILAVEEEMSAVLPAVLRFLTRDALSRAGVTAVAVAAMVRHVRERRGQLSRQVLSSLQMLHGELLASTVGALPAQRDRPHARPVSFVTVDEELRRLLPTDTVYCTVLTISAVATLALRPPAEEAFVRMMVSYQRKGGAVAVLLFESLCDLLGEAGREVEMLRRWYQAYTWLSLVPLGLSLQLEGTLDGEVCCATFTAAKNVHSKVMLICGTEAEACAARQNKVEPVITMETLVKRLGGQWSS